MLIECNKILLGDCNKFHDCCLAMRAFATMIRRRYGSSGLCFIMIMFFAGCVSYVYCCSRTSVGSVYCEKPLALLG
jgi:hypothetical protein